MEKTLENIIRIAKEKHISQVEICSKLGLAKAQFSNWKKDRSESYLKYVPQIADILGVTILDIYGIPYFVGEVELTQEEKELVLLMRSLSIKKQEMIKSFITYLALVD